MTGIGFLDGVHAQGPDGVGEFFTRWHDFPLSEDYIKMIS
jgi:hypothetical protein